MPPLNCTTDSIAIASNPDAAVHAARGLPGVTIIPRGQEAAQLGDLPVELLEPLPRVLDLNDRAEKGAEGFLLRDYCDGNPCQIGVVPLRDRFNISAALVPADRLR